MKKNAVCALILAALMSWSPPSWGKNEALKDVKEVRLVLAGLSPGAAKCGLTAEALMPALETPLTEGNVTIVESGQVLFFVTVNTIHLAWTNFCVSNVRLEVYTSQFVEVAATKNLAPASVTLWESAVLFGGSSAEHADQVVKTLESRAAKFVIDWSAAQPQ